MSRKTLWEVLVSATRLLVLGVVRMHGSAHGYHVRRELVTWSADKWANVQPGSIYHALKKMTTEKLLEQVESEGSHGPDRTEYRLTEEGETEFQVLLSQALSSPSGTTSPEMSAAITLMTALPRARVISLLRHRLVQLEGDQRSAKLLSEQSQAWGKEDWGQPAHVYELYRLWEVHAVAALNWLRELIARLEAGEYVMADDSGRSFGEPPR